MKHRYWRALKEAARFTFWVIIFMAVALSFGVGTVLAVDALPLIQGAKILLTSFFWIIGICLTVAFFGSL